ncbi:serine/threonine-protein kinase KIN2 [Ceratobasidium sp. 395]|nr:serine/threonine-protein kinase KIN2 [Ceratobasidium sp. 395]
MSAAGVRGGVGQAEDYWRWRGGSTGVVKEQLKEIETFKQGQSGAKEKVGGGEKEREESAPVDVKPVYLKELLSSVVTTSTKPARIIKADAKRVLDRMQVQYREIRSRFECTHVPSIDLVSLIDSSANTNNNEGGEEASRSSLVRKGSRLSIGRKGPPASVVVAEKGKDKEVAGGGRRWGQGEGRREGKSSLPFAGVKGQEGTQDSGRTTLTPTPITPAAGSGTTAHGPPNWLARTKFLSPIPRDFAEGGFDNGTADELCMRFKISIVKVALLPLHAVQFRRVGGDGWQCQTSARRVLTDLKL